MSAVALDLLVAGDGAEDDLGEALAGEGTEANPSNRSAVLDQSKCLVLGVKHQPGDVLLRHPGQLVGEDVLEGNQPQHGLLGHFVRQAVGNAVESDHSFPLLDLGRLVPRSMFREHRLGPQHLVLILNDSHDLCHCLLETLVLKSLPLNVLMVLVKTIGWSLLTRSADITGD